MRIPIQQIVDGAPIVIDESDPDLTFLSPKKVVTIKNGKKVYDKYVAAIPSGDNVSGISGVQNLVNATQLISPIVDLDIPDLSDIESITYEQYYDSLKRVRVKAIIKIRNSSIAGKEVEGVDARIYDPSSWYDKRNLYF